MPNPKDMDAGGKAAAAGFNLVGDAMGMAHEAAAHLATQLFDLGDTFKSVIGSAGAFDSALDGAMDAVKTLAGGVLGFTGDVIKSTVAIAAAAATGGLSLVAFSLDIKNLLSPLEAAQKLTSGFITTLMKLGASATPHGMEIVEEAWKLVSSRIGVRVAPVIALLASGILTLGDYLKELTDQIGGVGDDWTEIVDDVTDAIIIAGDVVMDFVQGLISVAQFAATAAMALNKLGEGLNVLTGHRERAEEFRAMNENLNGFVNRSEKFSKNIDDVRKHMMEFGVNKLTGKGRENFKFIQDMLSRKRGDQGGEIMDIASVWGKIQQGALQNPIIQQINNNVLQGVKEITRLRVQSEQKNQATYQ